MSATSDHATVLIVEDEQPLADLFAQLLTPSYTVHTAANGREALDRMSHVVDVVLLDRRMPGLSGDEVLRAIRQEGYDCRVAMVTAVTPDVDILEMGFDDYLVKPVDKTTLNELVERLLELDDHDTLVREYDRLISKMAALEAEQNVFELVENEKYERLQDRLDELEAELDEQQLAVIESASRNPQARSRVHSRRERRSKSGRLDRPGRLF